MNIEENDILVLANKKLARVFKEGDIHIYDMDRTPNLKDYKDYKHNKDSNLDIIQIFCFEGGMLKEIYFNTEIKPVTEGVLQQLLDISKKMLSISKSKQKMFEEQQKNINK